MTLTAVQMILLALQDSETDCISDGLDGCPLEPETYNKFQDTDGCPDNLDRTSALYTFPHSDGDGIEHRWDSCTAEPADYNDYLGTDGCPDVFSATSNSLIDSDV